MYDYGIFIGRFQPFHLAHSEILKKVLAESNKAIVVIGSHNKSRNVKDPFTSVERIAMIKSSLNDEEFSRIEFVMIRDQLYNDNLWITDVQNQIGEVIGDSENVALFGFESDRSSYYLKLFPKWQFVSIASHHPFHATKIREHYFRHEAEYKNYVHPDVAAWMLAWSGTAAFRDLKEDFKYIENYREMWRGAPFPPVFVTVDAIVIKSGHVLVVRRRGFPGRNQIALPGGFIDISETIEQSALRELKEETAIKVDKEVLRNSIKEHKVFDAIPRSLRGRTITHAFYINLGAGPLPLVKGGDDAAKAFWMPLAEAYNREQEFFEDHLDMIRYFCHKY